MGDVGHEAFDMEPEGGVQKERLAMVKNLESFDDSDRQLIENYVQAHHGCLLRAWRENGNPFHGPGESLEVRCAEHRLPPRELLNVEADGLNAHLEEEHSRLHNQSGGT